MSSAITNNVKIEVESEYLTDRSDIERSYYFFAYHVTITNDGEESVQLLSRHWIITNANGIVEEVKGAGVIGEQPVIEPGDSYEYSSFCPLNTSVGSMEGTYQMVSESGEAFDAIIEPFRLACSKEMFH